MEYSEGEKSGSDPWWRPEQRKSQEANRPASLCLSTGCHPVAPRFLLRLRKASEEAGGRRRGDSAGKRQGGRQASRSRRETGPAREGM